MLPPRFANVTGGARHLFKGLIVHGSEDGSGRKNVTAGMPVTFWPDAPSLSDMNTTNTSPIRKRSRATGSGAELRPVWLPESVWPWPLGSVTAHDRRVVYTDTGGSGPVLLFVHVGQWSLLWGGVIGQLADRYRCVTLDVAGTGLSDRVPPPEQTLTAAADCIGAVIDQLELNDLTLVIHDLGGLAGLAAVSTRLERVSALAAVNTFGWRPRGVLLPVALRLFGSAMMRETDTWTGFLPNASSTRAGVGRHMNRATRQAWRAGLADHSARRAMHRMFADAARNHTIHTAAETALHEFAQRPLLTIFGQLGDYFGFQRQWRRHHPDALQVTARRGLHFPMCDNPALVANQLHHWHHDSRTPTGETAS